MVRKAGASNGVQIAFLSETEKQDPGGGSHREVAARIVRAEHSKLVAFLGSLQGPASRGAILREIRLTPSKKITGVYEEAEIVLVSPSLPQAGGQP